jgi:hypothetical protein
VGKESWIMHTASHLYRQRAVIALAIVAIALVVAPAHAQQIGIGLAPMRLEMHLDGGQQHSGMLTLSNDSGTKLRIRAELLDFFIDGDDTPQFERSIPQELPYSCRTWLTVNPMDTEVEGKQLAIRYSIRVPEGTKEGSYHCAAGFTALLPADTNQPMGIQTAVRAVTAFYVIVGKPGVNGELKGITLERHAAGKASTDATAPAPLWNAVVLLENHGKMHFRPFGQLEVLDAAGRTVQSYSFTAYAVLPLREQRFVFPLTADLPAAPYTLRARVDIGTGVILEAVAVISDQSGGN